SAAAKYDQAHGPSGAQSWELGHHGTTVPGLQNWWGHCNGWAAAAVLFGEPHATVPVAGTAFGIADQKSLLSEIAMEVDAGFFGVVVKNTIWWARDDVPGDFQTQAFSFNDSDSFESRELRYEVWVDQPVVFDSSGKITSAGNVILSRSGGTVIGGAWRNGNL